MSRASEYRRFVSRTESILSKKNVRVSDVDKLINEHTDKFKDYPNSTKFYYEKGTLTMIREHMIKKGYKY